METQLQGKPGSGIVAVHVLTVDAQGTGTSAELGRRESTDALKCLPGRSLDEVGVLYLERDLTIVQRTDLSRLYLAITGDQSWDYGG